MATAVEIQSEIWWQREIVTTELDWCADELCRRTGQPRTAAGTKGNTAHRNGAHRSQEWIRNSVYCTNRTYTVQAGLSADQARHIAGLDFTPGVWGTTENRRRMVAQTSRLLAAMRAGELDEVLELYGTIDGRTVTGWNNNGDRLATSDSSHLDHWHLTIDRRHLTNMPLMRRIVAIALGDPPNPSQEDNMLWFSNADREGYIGQFWLGDAMSRRLVTAQERNMLIYVANEPGVVPPRGGIHPVVRGNCDGQGPASSLMIDYDLLAAEIVEELPVGTIAPTAEEIADAVADEQAARLVE